MLTHINHVTEAVNDVIMLRKLIARSKMLAIGFLIALACTAE